ncbi:MAG: hypothetical protein EON55_11635 [Alphaproteobacteria bacterium]|nr:MAG: hypothetical protein EON55_11635 [Alphaproteobacteria bacterium]
MLILLTHGCPGSTLEFTDVIGLLTNPARYGATAEMAFHVVISSLPKQASGLPKKRLQAKITAITTNSVR